MWTQTPLELDRKQTPPELPQLLKVPADLSVEPIDRCALKLDGALQEKFDLKSPLKAVEFRPKGPRDISPSGALKVGAFFSGGQAPGGHNVLAGLHHALQLLDERSSLWGFLGGPEGLLSKRIRKIDSEVIANYLNLGGFDMIGSGRLKIETPEQFAKALETCKTHQLDGLVVIGGDDSNTNAALLAKYFRDQECSTRVVGVPKTIDGDLKGSLCEISFGHDTACKVYSELIGNVARDAISAGKYYHFIRLMGRSASHIALECALQTQPTFALIGEEVRQKGQTLKQIVDLLVDIVTRRADAGKHHGVFLIPEGLVEFIPEMRTLIDEINELLGGGINADLEAISARLTAGSKALVLSLPRELVQQLLLDRDPHGNVQVSRIETEKLIAELVATSISARQAKRSFDFVTHFFGYEARASLPSHFDSDYTFALGATAAVLIDRGYSGYMAVVSQLTKPTAEWQPGGFPIAALMARERRSGEWKFVIQKALVDLAGLPFASLERLRARDICGDYFSYPGPIQFYGPVNISKGQTLTLGLEHPHKGQVFDESIP